MVVTQQVVPGCLGVFGRLVEERGSVLILLGHHFDVVPLDLVEAEQRTHGLVILHVFLIVDGGRPLLLRRRIEDERLLDGQVLQVGGEMLFELHVNDQI
jgi:hypothetical protein